MNFVELPSGIVINVEEIEYFLGVNAYKEERKRNPSCFLLSIQFLKRDDPITLSYKTREEAAKDHRALCEFCSKRN